MKKHLFKSSYLLSLIIISFSGQLYAQSLNFSDYLPASPKTPNAAALGQYVDIPVSLYTGVPEIQVPVYEIKVGTVSIPISLSYHASGVKVEDYPSWVGTGWVLNAGGVISRQQRGVIDETMIDNYNANQSYVNSINNDVNQSTGGSVPANNMFINKYDTESDIFNYNLPNGGGKFYLDVLGNSHTMPANKFKIQGSGRIRSAIDLNSNSFQSFHQWVITDNQGVKYFYGSNAALNRDTYEVTELIAASSGNPSNINSWYLAEIQLPNGESIQFNYETYTYTIPLIDSYSAFADSRVMQDLGNTSGSSFITYTAQRLKNIIYPNGKVEFVAGGFRADLPKDKVLDRIEIYNQVNSNYQLLKTYKLFTNNLPNVVSQDLPDNSNAFRLNLDSVAMYSSDQVRKGAYSFAYNTNKTSLARSASQDFWGYYNGLSESQFNPMSFLSTTSSDYARNAAAGFRATDPNYSQFDILTRMTYPTGGYTDFTFESNQANLNDPALVSYLGGLTSVPVTKQFLFQLANATSGNVTGFSDEFTTGNTLKGAVFNITGHELSYDGNACPLSPASTYQTQCYSIWLYKKNADGTFSQSLSESAEPFTTYKVKITWNTSAQGMAYVQYAWQEFPQTTSTSNVINVGGLRVSKMQSYDPVTNNSLTKKYVYTTDANISSGTIGSVPIYYYNYPLVVVGSAYNYNVFTITSQNQSPLFNTSGSGIGYSCVTEYTDDNGTLGKNVYKYTSNDLSQPGGYNDVGVIPSLSYPFPQACSYEWKRGNLLSKYSYVNNNGVYNPVLKIDNNYRFYEAPDLNYNINTNIKILQNEVAVVQPNQVYTTIYNRDYVKYNTVSEAFIQSSSKQTIYDSKDYTTSVLKLDSTILDPVSLEPGLTRTNKSNGNFSFVQSYYSSNYNTSIASDDASLGLQNLMANNELKAPVEQLKIFSNQAGQSFVSGGSLFFYYKDKPLVSKFYSLKIANPVPLQTFMLSSINSSGQFVYDPRYELNTSIDSYTLTFNVAQQTKYGTSPASYIWGYNGQYPVAEIQNSSVNDVYFENFEDDAVDFESNLSRVSSNTHTGNFAGLISNPGTTESISHSSKYIAINSGTARMFTYSGWVYSDNPTSQLFLFMYRAGETGYYTYIDNADCGVVGKWTYIKKDFMVPADVVSMRMRVDNNGGGNVWFDDLSIQPYDAQLSSYTYSPLVGITSQTDPKGKTTYYEYDQFQRLKYVKDQDKNIIKSNSYNYKH